MTHAQFIHTYVSTHLDLHSPVFDKKFVSLWVTDSEVIAGANVNDEWAMFLMFDGI